MTRTRIFVASLTGLFLEMALIRWLPAHIPYLAFFTNTVMLGCFLGLAAGCVAAGKSQRLIGGTPILLFLLMLSAIAVYECSPFLTKLVDVGGQLRNPSEVFFGTEYAFHNDFSKFYVPIEVLDGFFFLLTALVFLGIGQEMARAMVEHKSRLASYAWNIAGSILGVLVFALLSWLQTPPIIWFLAASGGLLFLLFTSNKGHLLLPETISLCMIGLLSCSQMGFGLMSTNKVSFYWSPYYVVRVDPKFNIVYVNNIGHQEIKTLCPNDIYSFPYSLRRDVGLPPAKNVLIIGAGTGNDVSRALMWGAEHIDAVEIDPVVYEIGKRLHPLRPYDNSRVSVHITDGRHFLSSPTHKYDLIIFALVDSLVLHSSYANTRLESFLFTKEAFMDARKALSPGGNLVLYNYYRWGWVTGKIDRMLQGVFGDKPLVFTFPYRPIIKDDEKEGMTLIQAGANDHFNEMFQKKGSYYVSNEIPSIHQPSGFTGPYLTGGHPIKPSLVEMKESLRLPTDDWPFLYSKEAILPPLNLRNIAIILACGFPLVFLCMPSGKTNFTKKSLVFFLLGAAFMLLTSHSIVRMALLLGNTWVTNAVVSCVILFIAFLSNLWVMRSRSVNLNWVFGILLLCLLLEWCIPYRLTGTSIDTTIACVMLAFPIFLSGTIFSRVFDKTQHPDQQLGYNIAGALVGGLLEYACLLIGFGNITMLAFALYGLAWVFTSSNCPTPAHRSTSSRSSDKSELGRESLS